MAKANTPNHLFDPAIWSDEVMRQAMDVFHFTSKQSSEYIFMKMMEKNKEQVTNAVRDQIHAHLPKSVAGPVGDRIRDSLEEVREFHWKDLEESQETWAYELRFNVEGEKLCIRKQFTLDKIVTEQVQPDGQYAIPYSNILAALLLTEEEALVLATAL